MMMDGLDYAAAIVASLEQEQAESLERKRKASRKRSRKYYAAHRKDIKAKRLERRRRDRLNPQDRVRMIWKELCGIK